MRILHTSDLHLGLSLNNVSFIEDQRAMINSLIEIIAANGIEAVLISGDIFDRAVSSAAAISLYDEMCTLICIGLGVPVLICAGNHDGAARLASCSELLKRSGLYIAGKIADRTPPVEFDGVTFHFMPHFTIDEARAMFPDDEIKTYADAVKCYTDSIEITPDKRNILLAHLFVAGSETCVSDKTAVAGGTIAVPVQLFEKFDYVALGHLHKPQTVKNARYSGSPLKYSFAEADHVKSATVFDTADMIVSNIAVIPPRDMRCISGTYDEVTAFADADTVRDDYIKIELTDRFPSAATDRQFQEIYTNLLQCTGRSITSENSVLSVTVEEFTDMTPLDVLTRYCAEVAEIDLDDEMISWFTDAVTESNDNERGDDI